MVCGTRVWDLRELKDVIIPEETERIGKYWFYRCSIASVEIPASVKYIDAYAFYECKSLKCVTFAEGSRLERIGENCFSESKIIEISIPSNVTLIEEYAFYDCKRLKRVTFAEDSKLERIGDWCFLGSGIGEIKLPGTLKKIGDGTFCGCDNLKTVYVEDRCEISLADAGVPDSANVIPLPTPTIGGIDIQDLRKMKNVVIPEGTEKIGNYWFWDSWMESITVPASVREIGADAFYRCRNLRRVTFAPRSKLKMIGVGGFRKSGIGKIVIPKNTEEILDSAFKGCGNLTEIVIERGSKLKTMHNSVFYDCYNLKNIRLPDGLEKIGIKCFNDSGLE